MALEYVDPRMPRRIDGWHSPILGVPMPIVTYGYSGHPLLLFPTAAADFLENERFFLIKAIEPAIMQGRVRVFSIDSINRMAWMDRKVPVQEQARRQALYSRYIEEEVVPYIRHNVGDGRARIATTGASFGAFHAMNTLCRRPDVFDAVIAMSGFYDLEHDYLKGYSDDNCYFNNPAWYVPQMQGEALTILQHHCSINIVTGQGAYEVPDASRRFSSTLSNKGIRHTLDVWGHDVDHDWPWWRKMLPYFIDRMS
ncbi:MAG TPA: alpha/beta hydrolase-fold protein [Thermoanaerobaculia bacterium]|nr:alpha/beta hydrolase-fold protein [Thermoanaerobaculia bacterium]